MSNYNFVKHIHINIPKEESLTRAEAFNKLMQVRRTVRDFKSEPIEKEVIEQCLLAAGSAPSGANKQPWKFVVVSDPAVKKIIREEAEKEEKEFYSGKAPQEWLDALAPLGTNESKPFLEEAPYLIIIFEEKFQIDGDGNQLKNYYTKESIGIATGFLIAALHSAGIATLTHTPSPMNFLNNICKRGQNEKPFLILVAGYPASDALVPNIKRKSLDETTTFI